jgi:hypothetical protein
MTFGVHRNMEHPNHANASLNLRIEDDVAGVCEPIVASANVLDAAPHVGHFGELREATLKPEKVVVSLTLAELGMRIDLDIGQILVGGSGELKLGHRRGWISRGR